MQHPSGGYVFVVTYGRSGSTVLQTVLQSIDGYYIKGENNNLLKPLYEAYKLAHEARYLHGKANPGPQQPWYGAYQIDPKRFTQKLLDVFVEEIIQPPSDARVVGFKEIRFHQIGADKFEDFLNFVADFFPGTKFIFNTRNWEAVARSSWWKTMKPENVQAIIEEADSLYHAYAAKYPERSHVMKHEVYKGNPAAFMGLFHFLGEEFDEARVASTIGKELTHCRAWW